MGCRYDCHYKITWIWVKDTCQSQRVEYWDLGILWTQGYHDHVIAYNICTIMYDDIYVLYYICIYMLGLGFLFWPTEECSTYSKRQH